MRNVRNLQNDCGERDGSKRCDVFFSVFLDIGMFK